MPSITLSEERGVRFLHFGSEWVQGAMRISRPWDLVLEYTRDLMVPLLFRPSEWPGAVLQIGLGSASVTKFLYRGRPQSRITVVETLPEVVAVAFQYFKLPDDPERIVIEIGDGHAYAALARPRFDLILVDGFDANGNPGRLDSTAFYASCKRRLARNGIMSVNLLTRRRGVDASAERMRESFDHVVVIPPSEAGNTVALAARDPIDQTAAELRTAAQALRHETGLNLLPALSRLARAS